MECANTENLFNELVAFIRNISGAHDFPITKETLIENDLGVTGDDAAELLMAFSKKYHVELSHFNFAKYFYDEPGILDFIRIDTRKKIPFTVGHLEQAIFVGRLDDVVINS